MIRVLVYFAMLAAIALGLNWLSDQPGSVGVTYGDKIYTFSIAVAGGCLLIGGLLLVLFFWIVQVLGSIPGRIAAAALDRRNAAALQCISRGLIAVNAGDIQQARQAAKEAKQLLSSAALTHLLEAQVAQMQKDRQAAEIAYKAMALEPQTRLFGLRGLYGLAESHGEHERAFHYALAADKIAALPWASEAVLRYYCRNKDWTAALALLESTYRYRLIDKNSLKRQRAVLSTARARQMSDSDPEGALKLVTVATREAPELVPASVLTGRLYTRLGDIRKATKVLESAWVRHPHPELGRAYLDVRPGDSSADRLDRARTLFRLKPQNIDGQILLASAAIDAHEYTQARKVMGDLLALVEARPDSEVTFTMCLLMARLEETEHHNGGAAKEWLVKSTCAKADYAWVAGDVISDEWQPTSPETGQLDAFEWRVPNIQKHRSELVLGNEVDQFEALPKPDLNSRAG